MSSRSTTLLARRSIRARLGRTIAIAVAIFAGVSFVVGSFVLADSLRATFTNLFSEINENVDLQVRSEIAFGTEAEADREPIPLDLVDDVEAVEGVAKAEPFLQRYAQYLRDDGTAVATQGAPLLGVTWSGDPDSGLTLREGRAAEGSGEVAMDKATADREGFSVGDEVEVLTDTGRHTVEIVGLVGLADTDGFAGATLAAFDLETGLELLGAGDRVDVIDLQVDEGAEVADVRSRLEEALPERVEVVSGDQVAGEAADSINEFVDVFGTGLLIFAFVTAFVSAFIINNVFAITIGQRLRELALLRAVGAAGRQVRRMITFEALVMSVIATLLGILGGIGFARLMVALFNSAGLGFPDTGTVLQARTVGMAFVVGVGITMLSVIVPARRAAKVPPVAAMRPELGFAAISARRLVLGSVVTAVGAVMFLIGLFLRPGGGVGLGFFAGVGGLLLFLGTASLSATVARPVTRALGWPIQKLFGTAGLLARENAARSPRRTSASAAALMIGVALVSAAAVFAASLRDTFTRVLDRAVTADYVITDGSFQGMPPAVARTMRELPELSALSPIRVAPVQIDGSQRGLGAVDPDTLDDLIDIDVQSGGYDGVATGGILVHDDSADDLGVTTGDEITVLFQNGDEDDFEVAGVYGDNTIAGNYLVSIDTFEQYVDQTPRDAFVVARLAEGVDPALGDIAVREALDEFPQLEVQTNAEFRQQQEDQIDQLLIVITALLFFAIAIAVLGISITLALSVFERTREIGLLRAVGMNKRRTRRAVRWEAVIVSVFGALVGVVLGSLIGVALAVAVPDNVIEVISFSPGTTLLILVGAVVAGLLASLYPSYKASNMNVLEAIATE
ncbi:MAG: FtsX-like permease family protein [Ilumatobacteraceae bacterium]